jgi:hypothetical protein
MVRRKRVRRWEYCPGAAYASEFAEALSEGGTGRIETIESLGWLKRRVKKGDRATYVVQIVD